jgi:hypothetical protein
MKNLQDICYAIGWCSKCDTLDIWKNPCHDRNTDEIIQVPDYIPNEQILKYLEEKKLVR